MKTLGRNVLLPDDAVEEGSYAFDPISDEDMLGLQAEAEAIADVVVVGAIDPKEVWSE